MNDEEQDAISLFCNLEEAAGSVNALPEADNSLTFGQQAVQNHAKEQRDTCTFIDTRFLVPTTNICERLFSKAGFRWFPS